MNAVLGPRLREGFQFDIGGLALGVLTVVGLDSLHFREAEEQVAFARELLQGRVIEIANGHVGQVQLILLAVQERFRPKRRRVNFMNHRIGEHLLSEGAAQRHSVGRPLGSG